MNNLTNFIRIVLRQCKLAMEKGEIPIASVIVDPIDERIIARSFNQEIASNNPIMSQTKNLPKTPQSEARPPARPHFGIALVDVSLFGVILGLIEAIFWLVKAICGTCLLSLLT